MRRICQRGEQQAPLHDGWGAEYGASSSAHCRDASLAKCSGNVLGVAVRADQHSDVAGAHGLGFGAPRSGDGVVLEEMDDAPDEVGEHDCSHLGHGELFAGF